MVRTRNFAGYITGSVILLAVMIWGSCKKDESGTIQPSSIKIISTENEPKQVNMISSNTGEILAYVSSGDLVVPPDHQELFILNSNGDIQNKFSLSDTLFQHLCTVPALDGGFMICGTANTFPYIAMFHVSNTGEVMWSKSFQVKFGTNKNRPAISISHDGNYLVMYQSYGSGYYIWKGDVNGNEISNSKYPTPNSMHPGSGLNYGEKYVDFLQVNDTLIITQGINYDEYDQLIENCFLRAVSENMVKKWYSTNYDSAHFEFGSGLAYVNNKVILFGSRSDHKLLEYAGNPFIRTYNTDGTFEGDRLLPQVGGTPTIIRKSIRTPEGGYLLVGNNNQLPLNDLVSPNQAILIKLGPDLAINWSRVVNSGYPVKGYDAVYHKDGTIGLIGLMKDNYSENKLLYMHLDGGGGIINN